MTLILRRSRALGGYDGPDVSPLWTHLAILLAANELRIELEVGNASLLFSRICPYSTLI
jgi:hypothetical protein